LYYISTNPVTVHLDQLVELGVDRALLLYRAPLLALFFVGFVDDERLLR